MGGGVEGRRRGTRFKSFLFSFCWLLFLHFDADVG
jgi:hypothetical protein